MVESAPLPEGEPSAAERLALERNDETTLAITIARRYYFQEQSKVTIGRALGLSRFQVARLLQEARRDGLVRIEIGRPGRIDDELSDQLRKRLGIQRAVVVETSGRTAREFVGKALADTLAEESTEGATVGLTWSRATAVMAEHIRRLRAGVVLQLGGAMYPPEGVPGSVEVVRAVAAASGSPAYPIYAPLLASDAQTAEGLRRQPEIAAAIERFAALDIAVLSVGAWQPGGSAVYDLLTSAERAEQKRAGACGEISGRLFDRDGTLLPGDVDERVVGIDAEQLRAVPKLITSSTGTDRAEATRAAVAAGFVHTLVVDDELAKALL
ncbi:sugar-binding transcriptional regulator [Saccharopolyspora phatthalungensis]|uniref:DNA-binding transcriptional regulator LsrR (DeoR family) n=1 Tax=Saccharopolyspora phatthalungensis TaxID=664693 RepID=A0A840Q9R8_9PSEU|nr:sugar-binding domain-containing protein [Saccharopolyspora phatthalungensis]MBB5156590.1 DNA-binding transcriptional regulator LsrR (DeoR family) [Saccharopolyspora phatthalungensis]